MTFSFARYMFLDDDKFNAESLKKFAEETNEYLKSNDFSAITERFGHEVVSANNPTRALEKNLKLAVWEVEKLESIIPSHTAIDAEPVVEFWEGRADGILATVNSPFLYARDVWLQTELLVVGYNRSKYLIYNGVCTGPNIPGKVSDPELQLH